MAPIPITVVEPYPTTFASPQSDQRVTELRTSLAEVRYEGRAVLLTL